MDDGLSKIGENFGSSAAGGSGFAFGALYVALLTVLGLLVLVSAGKDDGRPDGEEDAAWLLERVWAGSRRFKPREVVGEFAKSLRDELDLMREAANCSLLRRNFRDVQDRDPASELERLAKLYEEKGWTPAPSLDARDELGDLPRGDLLRVVGRVVEQLHLETVGRPVDRDEAAGP